MIERRVCVSCGRSHRLLPDDQIPHKYYSTEVIEKAVDDELTEEEVREYEDYPVENTRACLLHNRITKLQTKNGQCCMTILDKVAKLHHSIPGTYCIGWHPSRIQMIPLQT